LFAAAPELAALVAGMLERCSPGCIALGVSRVDHEVPARLVTMIG